MSVHFVLLLMVFCHVVDDYYLQGILANLKQKSWWKQNAPGEKYKNDFAVALIIHAFSWAFMVMLPIFFVESWEPSWWLYIVFVVNLVIHAVIDHLKANEKVINLIQDQSIHILQIIATWTLWALIKQTY